MEGIREQLVKRPSSPADGVKKIGIICGSIFIALMLLIVVRAYISSFLIVELAILLAIGIVWGGITLAGRMNVEYEYTVVDGELTVDKIYNKRTRKNLCSFKLRSADAFYSSDRQITNASTIEACGDGNRYTIEFSDQQNGKCALVFTPDERTLEIIKPYLPRAI